MQTIALPALRRVTRFGWLLLLGMGFPLAAAEPWTSEDVVNTERLGSFTSSPVDPRLVVWEQSAPDKEKNELVTHLFRHDPDQPGRPIQLTRGNESCQHPLFSPDSRRLAFLSARPLPKGKDRPGGDDDGDKPRTQIWLMEQGEPYPLTGFDRAIKDFAWRDTNRIVFLAPESPTHQERDFKERKDGATVVEDEATEPPVRLFEIELSTKAVTRVSTNTDWISTLAVSPDGNHAVTIHQQSLRFEYDNAIRPRYFLTDLRTGARRQIFTDRRFNLLQVQWAPDSRAFYAANAFTTHPKYLQATVAELWRCDLPDASETQVALDWPRGLATETTWFAAGPYLSPTPDGCVALLADGARVKAAQFTRDGPGWKRAWIEGPYATNLLAIKVSGLHGTNHVQFVHSTASQPPQLHAGRLEAGRLTDSRLLSSLNEAWKEKARARTEIVRWKGARGEEVEGLLHYPHAYQPGQRGALVLMTHGGPFGADLDAWADRPAYPIQLHCQRGAFVLQVNYHGSSSYGLEFATSIAGGNLYYELPVADLESGVQTLIDRGLVDPDRVGALGWSNGAILTLAVITHNPGRYKAAASGAGGFEWVADTSITSFGQAFNDYYFGAMPWQDPANYMTNAPYYQADRIRTPLLIFHGDADRSVPFHHGWMQFRALQQRTRTPVRFLTFPGEEHGFKKLAHLKRKVDEELAWFDRYLYGTTPTTEPWIKEGSRLAAVVGRMKAKREGDRWGVVVSGKLVPEIVTFKGIKTGRFEVTAAQYAQFETGRLIPPGRENFPVDGVSFDEARKYCAWLSQLTGATWRLPNATEAAALYEDREGEENTLDVWAGYAANPEDATQLRASAAKAGPDSLLEAVGSHAGTGDDPLFDLGGNVAEWTTDKEGQPVPKGGSADQPKEARNVRAQAAPPYTGFRVVKE